MINKWTWLLVAPWAVVWTSSMTAENNFPICPVVGNELCPGSYVPDFKNHTITCHEGEDGCQDFVEALNEAHERRIENTFCTCPNGEEVDCMHGGSCK